MDMTILHRQWYGFTGDEFPFQNTELPDKSELSSQCDLGRNFFYKDQKIALWIGFVQD
jgi:hypothetical protein